MSSNRPKKTRNFCKDFCTNYGLLNIKKDLYFFDSALFLEARAEILTKISLLFGRFEGTKMSFRN